MDLPLTRAEAVTILARAADGKLPYTADLRVLKSFKDAAGLTPEAQKAFASATLTGLVQGRVPGYLSPDAPLT